MRLTKGQVLRLVNEYIGVSNNGYLGLPESKKITYLTHADFYPHSLEKCYYDSVGNLIYRKLNEKEFNYEYDLLGQLINYDEFDFIRNPINSNINELNEFLEYGIITCEYDLNGSLIAKHTPDKSYFFKFDALGRLIQINSENLELHFTYDPLGRRLSKSIFRDGEEIRETYLYQNKNEIASFKDGKLKEIRIPGKSFHENIVKSIAIEIKGKTYAPIYDIQGNILKLIDIDNKAIIEIGPFDSFGKLKDICSNGFIQILSDEVESLFDKRYCHRMFFF